MSSQTGTILTRPIESYIGSTRLRTAACVFLVAMAGLAAAVGLGDTHIIQFPGVIGAQPALLTWDIPGLTSLP